ncbi:Glycoside hydrolase, catalytic core [Penicillium camemberti]|uniref:glucan 1,3-beta-glucosidase n=1 Tax=Penicillium camemberti (strain FM 013) TaxID=1429867 RepID=A0A0G4PVY5_PENC3|nr:Glycoside hydrolase, catalytic core [Penicillium camemberti]
MLWKTVALVSLFASRAWGKPSRQTETSDYIDWKTFKANGVNLGGWLIQEPNIDPIWWDTYSGGAPDEWGLCKNLGSQCGPVLEERYATWITTSDIDKVARSGATLLRIPTTYSAWIQVPGSQLYSGNQTTYLHDIATYAIEKHGMHIILDVHGLPGGINGLTIGEADGHWGWFHNQTNFDYSMQVIDAIISFIQNSGHPESYTLEPMNEPTDNRDQAVFGTIAALSDKGAAWILKYIHAVLDRVASVNSQIPVMFQGSFKNEKYWSGNFTGRENMVFDVHNYYFAGRNTTSLNLPSFIRSDAKTRTGDRKFPVFVGEWSIQALHNNTHSLRAHNLNYGLKAFHHYSQGSSYWTWKFNGNDTIEGEGTQGDYWNYEYFVDNDYVHTDDN